MKKETIIKELNISFDKLIKLMDYHPKHKFSEVIIEGKWTAGQHIEHLRISTAPVNKVMKVPKILLRYKFGICNRQERSFDSIVKKYERKLNEGNVKAPSRFTPKFLSTSEKEKTLEALDNQRHTLIKNINKWSEKALSKYVIPHPVLGKMTMREMLYFTILHTDHHRLILKERY